MTEHMYKKMVENSPEKPGEEKVDLLDCAHEFGGTLPKVSVPGDPQVQKIDE